MYHFYMYPIRSKSHDHPMQLNVFILVYTTDLTMVSLKCTDVCLCMYIQCQLK